MRQAETILTTSRVGDISTALARSIDFSGFLTALHMFRQETDTTRTDRTSTLRGSHSSSAGLSLYRAGDACDTLPPCRAVDTPARGSFRYLLRYLPLVIQGGAGDSRAACELVQNHAIRNASTFALVR